MSERIVNSKSSGACRAANPRTARLRRSVAIARSVWTAKLPVSATSSSMCRSSAAPITSNPGPRLAEDAGTRTSRRLCKYGLLDRGDVGLARDDRAGVGERGLAVLEPVGGEHADDALGVAGAVGQHAGHAAGACRLAERALVGGEEAVGLEDLRVADRGDAAGRAGEGLHRL